MELGKAFVISAANLLQALVYLNTLIRAEAEDSSEVRAYANLTEEKLQALGELLRPMLWNRTSEETTAPRSSLHCPRRP